MSLAIKENRLSSFEVHSIQEVCRLTLNYPATVYLYGSRTKLEKKGGDIDLAIVVPDKSLVVDELKTLLEIEMEIEKRIGEQKIDIHFFEAYSQEPFFRIISKDFIKLWEFVCD